MNERKKYEEYNRSIGFDDFFFKEIDSLGNLVAVQYRTEYFPVYYIEPMSGNEKAFGFDLKSNLTREKAIIKAAITGELIISEKIRLVQKNFDLLIRKNFNL